jgi:hypothetical protein
MASRALVQELAAPSLLCFNADLFLDYHVSNVTMLPKMNICAEL